MLIETGISIDGTDITGLIARGGVQWSRNDIDGPSSGRTLSGLLVRDRVGTKIRLDITCRPLESGEMRMLQNLIYPEFVTVEYDDPLEGLVTKTMYANNNSGTFLMKKPNVFNDGEEYWGSVSFPLVER